MYCKIHIQNFVYYCKFRHIQANSHLIQTYSAILWNIQNPAQLLAYSESKIYSELCQGIFQHIQSTVKRQHIAIIGMLPHLGPETYSGSCLYRHIHTYSGIFNNESYDNITFLFFTLTYLLFNKIDIPFLITMASILMFD